MRPCLFALLVLASGLVAWNVAAQTGAVGSPEIVPAEHGVYALLHAQRVAGRLPGYRHEVLPLARGTVLAHLDSLSRHRLAPGARRWVEAYRREFAPPLAQTHAFLGDGEADVFDLGAERYLAFVRTDDGEFRIGARGGVQSRSSRGITTTQRPLADASGAALLPELEISGHWRDVVGFTSHTFNGLQVAGDSRVLRADPDLEPLYYVSVGDVPPGSFDRSTASVRVARGPFSAEIANERLRIGPSASQPLILASGVDYFPFLRAGIETRPVRYQFVHAALSDQSRFVNENGDQFLQSPERYFAMHRFEAHAAFGSVAFTEAVVYGQRGPEIAYLNPVFPIKPAEHALWDRDNSLFSADAVVRVRPGVEFYGTYLADDLSFSRIGETVGNNNKWAAQAGASLAAFGATAFAEYTRIEPFVYTHRFVADGSFFNGYTHNGFGLGHPLGPNADQWLAGAETWLPGGLRARGAVRYARRGENTVTASGEPLIVGGDVSVGTQPDPFIKDFLSGEVFTGPGAELDVLWEPVNSLQARLFLDWQRWDPGEDRFFLRLQASLDL